MERTGTTKVLKNLASPQQPTGCRLHQEEEVAKDLSEMTQLIEKRLATKPDGALIGYPAPLVLAPYNRSSRIRVLNSFTFRKAVSFEINPVA